MPRLPLRSRVAALLTTAAATVLLIVVGCAATCRPDWYEPTAIDYDRLRQDKVDLVQLQDRISAALNASQPIEFTLTEQQVNRWITARGELWPDAGVDLGPLRDPVVQFADGQIRMGATVSAGGFRPVLGMACRAAASAEVVRIALAGTRIGVLPVPLRAFHETLAESLERSDLAATVPESGVIVLRNDFVWPNGERRCRIAAFEVGQAVVRVVIEPY